MKPLISIVCPVYNEEETVQTHYEELNKIALEIANRYDVEFVYTDNCSTDNTLRVLSEIAQHDSRVRIFKFSRNFGHQNSIFTAYCKAQGDMAINFDADLQDSPSLLPVMLEQWEKGYKIVYGIRQQRKESWIIQHIRKLFYQIIAALSDSNTVPPLYAGDFMLIDKVILDLLRDSKEKNLYLRGLIFSYGFPRIGIPYTRDVRIAGYTKFNAFKLINLALDGIVNQSSKPLQFLFYIGCLMSGIFAFLLLGIFLSKIFNIFIYPTATATIILFVLLSITLNCLFFGVLGIYIYSLYIEIKNRPVAIIEQEIVFHNAKEKSKLIIAIRDEEGGGGDS